MPATNVMDPTSQWVLQTSNSAPLEQPPRSPAAPPRLLDLPLGIHRTTSHSSFTRQRNFPPVMHRSTSHISLTKGAPSHCMTRPPRQVRCTSSIHVHASSGAGPHSHNSSTWSNKYKHVLHRSPDPCIPKLTSTFPFMLQHVKQDASVRCSNTETGYDLRTRSGATGNVLTGDTAADHRQQQVCRFASMHKPFNSIAAAAAQHHEQRVGPRVTGASAASPQKYIHGVPCPDAMNNAASVAEAAVAQGQSDCVSNYEQQPSPRQCTVSSSFSATAAAKAQAAATDSAAAATDSEPTKIQKAVWRYKFMKRWNDAACNTSSPEPLIESNLVLQFMDSGWSANQQILQDPAMMTTDAQAHPKQIQSQFHSSASHDSSSMTSNNQACASKRTPHPSALASHSHLPPLTGDQSPARRHQYSDTSAAGEEGTHQSLAVSKHRHTRARRCGFDDKPSRHLLEKDTPVDSLEQAFLDSPDTPPPQHCAVTGPLLQRARSYQTRVSTITPNAELAQASSLPLAPIPVSATHPAAPTQLQLLSSLAPCPAASQGYVPKGATTAREGATAGDGFLSAFIEGDCWGFVEHETSHPVEESPCRGSYLGAALLTGQTRGSASPSLLQQLRQQEDRDRLKQQVQQQQLKEQQVQQETQIQIQQQQRAHEQQQQQQQQQQQAHEQQRRQQLLQAAPAAAQPAGGWQNWWRNWCRLWCSWCDWLCGKQGINSPTRHGTSSTAGHAHGHPQNSACGSTSEGGGHTPAWAGDGLAPVRLESLNGRMTFIVARLSDGLAGGCKTVVRARHRSSATQVLGDLGMEVERSAFSNQLPAQTAVKFLAEGVLECSNHRIWICCQSLAPSPEGGQNTTAYPCSCTTDFTAKRTHSSGIPLYPRATHQTAAAIAGNISMPSETCPKTGTQPAQDLTGGVLLCNSSSAMPLGTSPFAAAADLSFTPTAAPASTNTTTITRCPSARGGVSIGVSRCLGAPPPAAADAAGVRCQHSYIATGPEGLRCVDDVCVLTARMLMDALPYNYHIGQAEPLPVTAVTHPARSSSWGGTGYCRDL